MRPPRQRRSSRWSVAGSRAEEKEADYRRAAEREKRNRGANGGTGNLERGTRRRKANAPRAVVGWRRDSKTPLAFVVCP